MGWLKGVLQVHGSRFSNRQCGNQIIDLNATLFATCRTDARSLATFKKMRKHKLPRGTEARKICLPLIIRYEFDGLKVVKMDRIYQLSMFMQQLGGTESEHVFVPTELELKYSADLKGDRWFINSRREQCVQKLVDWYDTFSQTTEVRQETFREFANDHMMDTV